MRIWANGRISETNTFSGAIGEMIVATVGTTVAIVMIVMIVMTATEIIRNRAIVTEIIQ